MKYTLIAISALFLATSCSTTLKSMKAPANYVQFEKKDFTFSPQVSAEAKVVRILGIDWKRLFKKEVGAAEGILRFPVVGDPIFDRATLYASYNLMKANPGYDVIFYPQTERVSKGFWPFYVKTTSTVKARLGKIN